MERVQAAYYDNSHDSAALLRLLINDCTTHHTQPNTKHTHTHKKKGEKKTCKKKKKKKEKKGSKRKLSMPVLNNENSEKIWC